MSSYYWDSIQHWASRVIEEHIDIVLSDGLEVFCENILYSPRSLREWFDEFLSESQGIHNPELLLAMVNSCDWNVLHDEAKKNVSNELALCE